MDEYNKNSDENSVHEILNKIKDGLLSPKLLSKEDRQLCVWTLMLEGWQPSVIAHLFKCSDKTIGRDLKDIKDRIALIVDEKFIRQTLGEFYQKSINHHSYLTRLGRSKDATISEKILAESAAWKVLKELIERLQSLGCLPSQPTQIVGSFFHHSTSIEEVSPEKMRQMLQEIEASAKETGILDETTSKRIAELKKRIEYTEIAKEVKQLENDTETKKEEEQDEQ